MSEQTADLCTTDACESLRARLAKYEDAEGNPKAQSGGVVLPEPDFYWVEADEGSWNSPEEWAQDYYDYTGEKPESVSFYCAVELPNRDYDSFEFDPDGSCISCRLVNPEAARLNSSPVTAGDDRKLSDIGNELHNLSCHVVHHNEGWANQLGALASELWNWQARATLTASAPMPDQARQYIESEKLCDSCGESEICCRPLLRDAKQSLTASAPSHGEQVRDCEDWSVFFGYLIDKYEGHEIAEERLQGWLSEMLTDPHYGAMFRREKVNEGQPSPIALAIEAVEEEHGSLRAAAKALGIDAGYLSRLKSGEKLNPGDEVLAAIGLERVTMYRAAATPSAGSQKEQGE